MDHTSWSQPITETCQGRDLKQNSWKNAVWQLAQPAFLHSTSSLPKDGASHRGLCPPTSIISQDNLLQMATCQSHGLILL